MKQQQATLFVRFGRCLAARPALRRALSHLAVAALSFVLVGLFALAALNVTVFNPVAQAVKDFSLTDVYYRVLEQGAPDTSRVVTIVDMTDLHDRADIARALQLVEQARPRVLGVDIVFQGHRDPYADSLLEQVACNEANIVFSFRLFYDQTEHSFFANGAHIAEGFANMERDPYSGMKRRLPLQQEVEGRICPSFVKKVADAYMAPAIPVADNTAPLADGEDASLDINFRPTHFEVVSATALLAHGDPRAVAEQLAGRVVLFGAMREDTDMHNTPLGRMAGVELLAYSVETLVQHAQLRRPSWLWAALLSLFVVWLARLWQVAYRKLVARLGNEWLRCLLGSVFVQGWAMFLWVALLLWVAFLVFCLHHVELPLGWAFAAIPFLEMAEEIFELSTRHAATPCGQKGG